MSLFQRSIPIRRDPAPYDPEPGVREPEPGTDFLPPNPDMPATRKRDRDLLDILESIDNNTRAMVEPAPGIIWQERAVQLATGSGDVSVIASERVRHLYIPNVPCPMRIYSGSSHGLFLGALTAGQTLQVELPYFTNGVFIEYESATLGDQVSVYFSSRAIDISVR